MADPRVTFDTQRVAPSPQPIAIGDAVLRRLRDFLFNHTLLTLRWLTIVTLLAVTLVWQMPARGPFETWHLIALFGIYSLLVQALTQVLPAPRRLTTMALLDLVAVGVLYALGGSLTGPVIALAVLSATMTSVFMSPVGAVFYTAGLCVSISAASITIPGWDGSQKDVQMLGGQLIILAISGIGLRLMTARVEHEQQRTRAEALRATRIAERDRARADFVATVSHELRTPLTATRAGLGMLDASAGTLLQPAERELLANSRRNVDRLGRLIDDLLAMNQLEAGTLRLHPQPVDLRDIARSAVSAIQPLTTAKAQHLTTDLPYALPLVGDAQRLEQVLINLLANAHRHTERGSAIHLTGLTQFGAVVITVADNGPGVPAEHLASIFAPGMMHPFTGGAGLGLSIATGLVHLHGGRLGARPVSSGGMCFSVELPARAERWSS